jgi:hypothetical protein
MSDPQWQGQIGQPYIINMEVQLMGVLLVDGRLWGRGAGGPGGGGGGRGNEGAGGAHTFLCYYGKVSFKLNRNKVITDVISI